MAMHSDSYDPNPAVKNLLRDLEHSIGSISYRALCPEIEWFFQSYVACALEDSFRQSECIYLRESINQIEQSSATLLEGILAGVELGQKNRKKTIQ